MAVAFRSQLTKRAFFLVVLGATLVHILLAAMAPISGDEAYLWDCSRHLDWSYFDQPPLVIWLMFPCRVLFGNQALAVRMPAILSSATMAFLLLGLIRRLGGTEAHAAAAYLALHAMPLFLIGSWYASTDVVMATACVGALWAMVALTQGDGRAWWGLAVAIGLGVLAKFPAILVLPGLIPVLREAHVRKDLRSPTPWLAAGLSLVIASPIFIWGAQNQWDNFVFQTVSRHDHVQLGVEHAFELVAGTLILATPFLVLALVLAWLAAWRQTCRSWQVLLIGGLAPSAVFALLSFWIEVAPHWIAPSVVLGVVPLVLLPIPFRRTLVAAAALLTAAVTTAAMTVASFPEALLELDWSYSGQPVRISTRKLAALIGNHEVATRLEDRLGDGELLASESYSKVHLFAYLSDGRLATRLANVNRGQHGLASLYWHRAEQLVGRDMLFVTERDRLATPLSSLFESVEEQEPLEIMRQDRVVRRLRVLRCRGLLASDGVFTRRGCEGTQQRPSLPP